MCRWLAGPPDDAFEFESVYHSSPGNMDDLGFISGASLRIDQEHPPQPSASSSKQASLSTYFGATEGSSFEIKKREYAPVTDKECYR